MLKRTIETCRTGCAPFPSFDPCLATYRSIAHHQAMNSCPALYICRKIGFSILTAFQKFLSKMFNQRAQRFGHHATQSQLLADQSDRHAKGSVWDPRMLRCQMNSPSLSGCGGGSQGEIVPAPASTLMTLLHLLLSIYLHDSSKLHPAVFETK